MDAIVDTSKYIPQVYQGKLEPNVYCRAWNEKRQKYCRNAAGKATDHLGAGRCFMHGGRNEIQSGIYSVNRARPRIKDLYEQYSKLTAEEALDTLPELAWARAIFTDWIERWEELVEKIYDWHESFEASYPSEITLISMRDLCDDMEAYIGPAQLEPDPDEPESYTRTRHDLARVRRFIEHQAPNRDKKPRKMLDIEAGRKILTDIAGIVDKIHKQRDAKSVRADDFKRVLNEVGNVVETVMRHQLGPHLQLHYSAVETENILNETAGEIARRWRKMQING